MSSFGSKSHALLGCFAAFAMVTGASGQSAVAVATPRPPARAVSLVDQKAVAAKLLDLQRAQHHMWTAQAWAAKVESAKQMQTDVTTKGQSVTFAHPLTGATVKLDGLHDKAGALAQMSNIILGLQAEHEKAKGSCMALLDKHGVKPDQLGAEIDKTWAIAGPLDWRRANDAVTIGIEGKETRGFDLMRKDKAHAAITLGMTYSNNTQKEVVALKGKLHFQKRLGDPIMTLDVSNSDSIPPGAMLAKSAEIDFNQFIAEDRELAGMDLKQMRILWQPTVIAFADDTEITAPVPAPLPVSIVDIE